MMKTARPYNFSAGPAMLPESILLEAQAELLDWNGLGVSLLEWGHRTSQFTSLLEQAEADLRELLHISSDYAVLFLGGAARTQFAMVPMNLLEAGEMGAYLVSGVWSSLAYQECSKISRAYCLGSSESEDFLTVPTLSMDALTPKTGYLYYTSNETVNGVRYPDDFFRQCVGSAKTVPLVSDMTSSLLSEPICIDDFGLIFAGAQKNIANAGLTVVIVRHDLLAKAHAVLPSMFDYRVQADQHSLYATPPTFNCYLAAKMFQWVKAQGGVEALFLQNKQKSEKLYHYIDHSSCYVAPVHAAARSHVNVRFMLTDPSLEKTFLAQATEQGLYGLQGHRLIGGCRASLYNAMPMAGVDALIGFMQAFAREHS